MSTTQPIRDKESLQKFKNFYKTQKPNPRNYAIIVLGLNTALRISDILSLTSEMVYDHNKVREHIVVKDFTKCLVIRMRSVPALDFRPNISAALNRVEEIITIS